MRRLVVFIIFLSAVFTAVRFNDAVAEEPLYIQNLSPAGGMSFPAPRSAVVLEKGSNMILLNTSLANHFVIQESENERLFLDGQTTKITMEWRRSLTDKLDVSLSIPMISQNNGFLDSEISNWHNFWGLPDGDRQYFQSDELSYSYQTPSINLDFSSPRTGVGDIALFSNYLAYSSSVLKASFSSGIMFSSGESDSFLGVGSEQISFAAHLSGLDQNINGFEWNLHAGYTYSTSDWFAMKNTERLRWFSGVSLTKKISERFSALIQLDAHHRLANNAIKPLGRLAAILSLGLRYKVSDKWIFDISFSEDIKVESAPDITFNGTLRYSWK